MLRGQNPLYDTMLHRRAQIVRVHPNNMSSTERQRREAASAIANLIVLEEASWPSARRQILRPGVPAPSGSEIESAVREAWAIYRPEEHVQILFKLRHAACRILERMEGLDAYLCGAVLNGAAGPETSVRIELFSDDVKTVEMTLLDAGLCPEAIDPEPTPMPANPEESLGLLWWERGASEAVPVRIEVFPTHLRSCNPRRAVPDAWQQDWEASGRICLQKLLSCMQLDGNFGNR